jgi:hypothetical protein
LKKRNFNFLALIALLSVFIVLSFASAAKSQTGEQQATFTNVAYSATIHEGASDTWTFTIHNLNCSENGQAAARFFLKFYVDNELFFDEFNSTSYKTWLCNEGSTISHNYRINPWSTIRPIAHDVRVELYWYINGTAHLEDANVFTVAVTIHIQLQDIFATGYLIAYLIACFVLLAYNYAEGLEE